MGFVQGNVENTFRFMFGFRISACAAWDLVLIHHWLFRILLPGTKSTMRLVLVNRVFGFCALFLFVSGVADRLLLPRDRVAVFSSCV